MLSPTNKLCLAGIYGHNERSNQTLYKELMEFWKITLKHDPKPFIF